MSLFAPTMTIRHDDWTAANLAEDFGQDEATGSQPEYYAVLWCSRINRMLGSLAPTHPLHGWTFNRITGTFTGDGSADAMGAVLSLVTDVTDYVIATAERHYR